MSAGTFIRQDKVRPGVYVNIEGEATTVGTISERGIAAFPVSLSWGNPDGVIVLDASSYYRDAQKLLGFRVGDERIRHITAAMNHARKLLLYRVNGKGGEKASGTIGEITVTAKYPGKRGNDITIVVEEDIDDSRKFNVYTFLEGLLVDAQTVASIEDLESNDYVEFSGKGELEVTAGLNLTGGKDGSVDVGAYSDAFATLETEEFHILGIPTEDDDVKQLAAAYVQRLRNNGKKIQAVVYQYAGDSEGIINLTSTIVLPDGTVVSPVDALWEIAAIEAAAAINESKTYAVIPGAADVYPKRTNEEIIQALQNGELVLTAKDGRVIIEQDINSLTSFSPTKPRMFSKNRVIRLLDGINNDFIRIFSDFFIGKVDNNQEGRNLFKAEIIRYMQELQTIGAIQNFNSQTDIIVTPGDQIDGVYAEVYVQPVDSMEKFYINVFARQGEVSVQLGGAA